MKNKVDLLTVQDINEPNITKCPYCGHDEYYVNIRYSGIGIWRYRFDGEDATNFDAYDCLKDTVVGNLPTAVIAINGFSE